MVTTRGNGNGKAIHACRMGFVKSIVSDKRRALGLQRP